METVKTLKLRIRDRHAKAMLAMARDVNTVWNFANETPVPQPEALLQPAQGMAVRVRASEAHGELQ